MPGVPSNKGQSITGACITAKHHLGSHVEISYCIYLRNVYHKQTIWECNVINKLTRQVVTIGFLKTRLFIWPYWFFMCSLLLISKIKTCLIFVSGQYSLFVDPLILVIDCLFNSWRISHPAFLTACTQWSQDSPQSATATAKRISYGHCRRWSYLYPSWTRRNVGLKNSTVFCTCSFLQVEWNVRSNMKLAELHFIRKIFTDMFLKFMASDFKANIGHTSLVISWLRRQV